MSFFQFSFISIMIVGLSITVHAIAGKFLSNTIDLFFIGKCIYLFVVGFWLVLSFTSVTYVGTYYTQ